MIRLLALTLAVAALPLLAVAPVLSGVMMFHDHGGGLHVHRLAKVETQEARKLAAMSSHQHGHGDDAHYVHGTPCDSEPERVPSDPEPENRCFVIVLPQIGVAPAPASGLAASLAACLTSSVCHDAPSDTWLADWAAPHGAHEPRLPTRGAVHRVLLASHALLI